jgi:hypothetical protein
LIEGIGGGGVPAVAIDLTLAMKVAMAAPQLLCH